MLDKQSVMTERFKEASVNKKETVGSSGVESGKASLKDNLVNNQAEDPQTLKSKGDFQSDTKGGVSGVTSTKNVITENLVIKR